MPTSIRTIVRDNVEIEVKVEYIVHHGHPGVYSGPNLIPPEDASVELQSVVRTDDPTQAEFDLLAVEERLLCIDLLESYEPPDLGDDD